MDRIMSGDAGVRKDGRYWGRHEWYEKYGKLIDLKKMDEEFAEAMSRIDSGKEDDGLSY